MIDQESYSSYKERLMMRQENEYQQALWRVGTKAAEVIELALSPTREGFAPVEKRQIEISLQLLVAIQNVPSPEKLE